MSRRAGVFACALAAIAGALAMPLSAASYRIDPRDTTAEFEVRFLGVFPIRGEFRRTTGTLVYDAASRQGYIEVFIDTTTLEASTENARASARGPDFFEVDKYPSIDFKSTRFVFDESKLKAVEGSLTLVGKTRPVTLVVNSSGCTPALELAPAYCRAAAELVVKRSDFGMKAWAHTVGEEVTIRIAITARQTLDKEPPRDGGREPVRDAPKIEPRTEPKTEPRTEPKTEPAPETPARARAPSAP